MADDIIGKICINDPNCPTVFGPNQSSHDTPSHQYVKINVGGYKFYTSVATLVRQESMLRAMFSGRMNVYTDNEGFVMIDRDGKHFGIILNYLRDGGTELPDCEKELRELLREAKYYCLENLVAKVEYALKMREVSWLTVPRASTNIILVNQSTSHEADAIVRSGAPVVKLTMNRHNNKYSYTTNSFDLLIRNNELFESLAVQFPHKVKFIKDIWGQASNPENGICTWSFYFNCNAVGELDEQHRNASDEAGGDTSSNDQATPIVCHSIFYGNEKKQTKVDFHENKVNSRFIKMFSLFIAAEEKKKRDAAELESKLANAALTTE